MAIRGRKPKPLALKKLEGNPGKRTLNENEPTPCAVVSPCPDWLDDAAKAEWFRLGGILSDLGVLTEFDVMAFAGYCQACARWKEAEEYLSKNGSVIETPNGYLQQAPQVSIAQTNLKIMLKFCEQFGLTPSARSRIIANNKPPEIVDDMEKLLGGEK